MLQKALLFIMAASTVVGLLGWIGDEWARSREQKTPVRRVMRFAAIVAFALLCTSALAYMTVRSQPPQPPQPQPVETPSMPAMSSVTVTATVPPVITETRAPESDGGAVAKESGGAAAAGGSEPLVAIQGPDGEVPELIAVANRFAREGRMIRATMTRDVETADASLAGLITTRLRLRVQVRDARRTITDAFQVEAKGGNFSNETSEAQALERLTASFESALRERN